MIDLSVLPIINWGYWVRTLGTSILAAVLAYALWAWLHSPHLVVAETNRLPIVDPTNGNTKYSLRAEIRNIGTKVALNCEGTLRMRVSKSENVIRTLVPTHWLMTKADLVVSDEETIYQTTIPAGRSQKLELMRQERTQNLTANVIASDRKFVETSPTNKWHAPVDEPLEVAFQDIARSTTNDVASTSSNMSMEDVKAANWESAQVELVVEAESARPLTVEFDITEEDGWVELELREQGYRRKAATAVYGAINRIRTGA